MTDEEKANNYELDCIADVHKDDVCTIPYAYSAQKLEQAYLDGLAEGRKEKCLEQNNDGIIRPCEVMKENEELKEQLKNNPYVQILQKEKAELAEDFAKRIEKMKNVGNCSKAMKCSKWVEQHIKGNKVTCCCGCKEWGSAE